VAGAQQFGILDDDQDARISQILAQNWVLAQLAVQIHTSLAGHGERVEHLVFDPVLRVQLGHFIGKARTLLRGENTRLKSSCSLLAVEDGGIELHGNRELLACAIEVLGIEVGCREVRVVDGLVLVQLDGAFVRRDSAGGRAADELHGAKIVPDLSILLVQLDCTPEADLRKMKVLHLQLREADFVGQSYPVASTRERIAVKIERVLGEPTGAQDVGLLLQHLWSCRVRVRQVALHVAPLITVVQSRAGDGEGNLLLGISKGGLGFSRGANAGREEEDCTL